MKTIISGDIKKDDVMNWCITNKKFTQKDQFECGYNWLIHSEFVETNNDHFLNGLRCAVKDGVFHIDDIDILFENYNVNRDPRIMTSRIFIDKNGCLSDWPSGFFDQTDIALNRLLENFLENK